MPASASARRARMIRCGKQGNCFYPGRRQGFGSGAVHHEDQKLEQDCRSEAQVCHEEGLLVHIQGSYQSVQVHDFKVNYGQLPSKVIMRNKVKQGIPLL
ncbi:hypothetical protein LINPERHAP1_LOCUS17648, partial [Linum perenne]